MTTPVSSPSSVFRSNAFGVAALIAALFVVTALAIAVGMMWRTSDVLVRQVVASLNIEAEAMTLEFQRFGLERARDSIARKSAIDGPGLYYLENADRQRLAGNMPRIPEALREGDKGGAFTFERSGQTKNGVRGQGVALRVPLGKDAVAFIGREIDDIDGFVRGLRWYLLLAFSALALAAAAAGYAIARRFLNRLGRVNMTVQSIMQGDLTDRVPVSGDGDELDTLAQNLNQMLDRINQLMISLREVSDNIAHDLKTPLNRLRNHAEGALRDPRGGAGYREGLERTIEEADGLIRTFNALLLIARLEAGSLERTAVAFDVGEILDDVSELYEPVAEEHGLTIKTSAPQPVPLTANKQLVVQAVANLIDNAIKYGSKCGTSPDAAKVVTVEARAERDQVLISVGDHGPGIPAADRARVLKRFVRLEQSRTQPGTGLGLSLVAAVARMHGGRIELDDNHPGLRVTLSLPRRVDMQSVA